VEELYRANCIRVSSSTLSARLGFTASQIRQDFSCFGEFGLQGYGYNVKKLRYEIREILGLNSRNTAVLVGCGNLGRALLKNFDFEGCGFFMLAAFDMDPNIIGTQVGSVQILDGRRLRQFVEVEKPNLGVLTVPEANALEVATLLAKLGVGALWNFTNCDLDGESLGTLVEPVRFSDSLLTLSYRLNQQGQEERDTAE
jgi:redox-sensing transcriptional repressor